MDSGRSGACPGERSGFGVPARTPGSNAVSGSGQPGAVCFPVPAVLLAGGSVSPGFAREAGLEPRPGARAMADINGLPMVGHVIRALRQASTVGRIVLVAPRDFPPQESVDRQLAGEGGLVDNIELGLSACEGASHAVLITADIPFVTGGSLDDYVSACAETGADLCYCAVPETACRARFPALKRTYLPTPARRYTGGNVVFVRTAAFPAVAALLRQAYPRRKNPAYLAQLIGPGNVLKLLTGRLELSDIEKAVSRAAGINCRLVVTEHADLGSDVDRPEDLRLARELLKAPRKPGGQGGGQAP